MSHLLLINNFFCLLYRVYDLNRDCPFFDRGKEELTIPDDSKLRLQMYQYLFYSNYNQRNTQIFIAVSTHLHACVLLLVHVSESHRRINR